MPKLMLLELQHFLFHRRLRCIYAVVPKSATTSIKHWFVATGGAGRPMPVGGNVHDFLRETCTMDRLGRQEAADLLADPAVFKFSFVRNPWTRLVSGYLDKMVGGRPPAHGLIRGKMKRTLRGRIEWMRHRLRREVEPLRQRGLTFREFVAELGRQNLDQVNRHFRPQSSILAGVPLDFIGRVEHFRADFAEVLRFTGERTPARAEHQQRYQPSTNDDPVVDWPTNRFREEQAFPHWQRFYPPDIEQQVADLFANDFLAYGYKARVQREQNLAAV